MKITAAVVDHQGADFELRDDVELCPMGPDDLQIHMVATGICHSDEALRVGDATIDYPIVLGHEGSGIVEKVGPEVTQFQPGDHVVLSFYACGQCANCLRGVPTQCLNYAHNNLSGVRPDGSSHFTLDGHHVADMFDQSSFTTTTVVRERERGQSTQGTRPADARATGLWLRNRLRYRVEHVATTSGRHHRRLWYRRGRPGRHDGRPDLGLHQSDCRGHRGQPVSPGQGAGRDGYHQQSQHGCRPGIRDLTGGYGVDWAVDTTGVTA